MIKFDTEYDSYKAIHLCMLNSAVEIVDRYQLESRPRVEGGRNRQEGKRTLLFRVRDINSAENNLIFAREDGDSVSSPGGDGRQSRREIGLLCKQEISFFWPFLSSSSSFSLRFCLPTKEAEEYPEYDSKVQLSVCGLQDIFISTNLDVQYTAQSPTQVISGEVVGSNFGWN